MSQVTVYTDLVFRPDSAIAEAKRAEAEFRGVAQRISATPIRMEVQFDEKATGLLAQMRNEVAQSPLRIAIEADDRLTPALAAIREEQRSIPILIPLGLDPASVAAVTAQIQSVLSAAQGGITATPAGLASLTGAAAVGALAGPTAAFAAPIPPTMPLIAAPAQGIIGTNVVTQAAPPATAATTAVTAAIAGAAAAQAVAQQPAPPVTAATPYATVPYSGVVPSAAGTTANYRALGLMFRTLLVGKAGYDVGIAGAQATGLAGEDVLHAATGEGYSTTRLQERETTIAAGQKRIEQIPIFGKIIEDIGAGIQRGASAYVNSIQVSTGDTRGGKRLYESDVGYAERTNTATEAQDKHTAELEREVAVRARISQQLDQAIQKTRDQAAIERASGQQRVDLVRQARQAELQTELNDPRFRDARGQLTGEGRTYQQARQQLIAAEYGQETQQQAVRGAQYDYGAQAAQLRDQGQNRAADSMEFEQRLLAQRERARGEGRLQQFDRETEPTLRRTFNREQGIDIQRQQQATAANVRTFQEQGREADLVTQDRGREAGVAARNFAIDERVRKLREVAAAETDVAKAAQMRAEAEAAADAGVREKRANNAEEQRRTAQAASQFIIERHRAELDSARDDFSAELRLFDEMWQRRVNATQAGTEREAAIGARQAARRALVLRHSREVEDIDTDTHELELRNRGQDTEAERYRIRQRTERQVQDAGGDTERVAALRARERQELRGVDRQSVAVFGSVTDFARSVMESDARQEVTPDPAEQFETLDAQRKRGNRPFRQNPLTASADARRRRGEQIRADREADSPIGRAARDAAEIATATMPGGTFDLSGGAGAADTSGPFDKQAAADFRSGSSDLKDAAASLNRTLSDEKNRIYVVR